jgi:hypothetical protein
MKWQKQKLKLQLGCLHANLHGAESISNRSSASQGISHSLLLPSQQPATCPYPPPYQPSLCPQHPTSWISTLIILPSMPRSSKWSLSLRFPCQNPVCTSPFLHTFYTPCPSHSFDHPYNIWWGVLIIRCSLSSPPPSYLVPLRPKYLPQHPIL